MTAVVKISGKQYRVLPGSTIIVDRINCAQGETLNFDDLLGGKPITAKLDSHILGQKVMTLKFKNKSRYSRRIGHRQPQSVLVFSNAVEQNKQK